VCTVCPSDLYFENVQHLLDLLPQAEKIARSGRIAVFGITPTYPETGYGYIKNGRFTEKPTLEVAKQFLEEGGYFWNSGIFVFQIKHFQRSLKNMQKNSILGFQSPTTRRSPLSRLSPPSPSTTP